MGEGSTEDNSHGNGTTGELSAEKNPKLLDDTVKSQKPQEKKNLTTFVL